MSYVCRFPACNLNARTQYAARFHSLTLLQIHPDSNLARSFNDYKPEFFYIRLLYVLAITVIAFCNAFLDPTNVLTTPDSMSASVRTGLLATMQAWRFGICVAVIALPCVVLIALLPNKNGSRWKMPLRIIFALLSLGMLALNAFSWSVQQAGDEASSGLRSTNVAFSFIVLAMSMVVLVIMAIAFVIFVVFRGARLEAVEARVGEQEREAAELATLARAVIELNQVQRLFTGWRSVRLDRASLERTESLQLVDGPVLCIVAADRRSSLEFDTSTGSGSRPAAKHTSADAETHADDARIAPDGNIYGRGEFVAFYGGTAEWDAAEVEERVAPDGASRPRSAFLTLYGGSEVEWGAAKPEKRASTSGSMYSKAEFIAHYGGTNEWRASALLAELGGVEAPARAESHSRSQLRKQRSAGFGASRF